MATRSQEAPIENSVLSIARPVDFEREPRPALLLRTSGSAELTHPLVAAQSTIGKSRHAARTGSLDRTVDVALALLFMTILLPVLTVLAALVWLSGSGPVIFRHRRIGLHGRSFECLKFRTMEVGAESRLPHLIGASETARTEWMQNHKIRSDPRVTAVGRVLRRFSFDELPQLVNVLRGEMSIVGPRPIVGAEICRYGPRFEEYCSVRPGITGLWQISGRNDVSYDRRVRLDCEYARSKSIRGDLAIILRTVPVLVAGSGC